METTAEPKEEPRVLRIPRRLLALADRSLWAIEEDALRTIYSILERENDSVEAVEAKLGRKLENTRNVTTRDGVAVIPVIGPIGRYASMFDDISGATSVQALATDFAAALADPAVRGIVFTFNSPGGTVAGISELADMIAAARGQKPMAGHVEQAGSAAYWLAAALPYLEVNDTAPVGSIGIVISTKNPAASKGEPARQLETVSDEAPLKRPDPASDAGEALRKRYANEMHEVFANKVAKYRNVSRDHVRMNFGRGAMRIGADAVAFGMADKVGSLEGLIAKVRAGSVPMLHDAAAIAGDESIEAAAGSSTKLAPEAVTFADSLISAGKVDLDTPWTISPDEENKLLGTPPDWKRYGQWFLGRDPGAATNTKGAYKYPHGKNGKVYRRGVIAAKNRAAVQGETEIVRAASGLLDRIDKKFNRRRTAMEDMTVEQLQAQNEDLRTKLAAAEKEKVAAELERRKTEAKAKVEAWQAEGKISGNATDAVRTFALALVAGEAVSLESFGKVIDALPKLGTGRIAAGALKTVAGEDVTKDDFAVAAMNVEVAKKIDAAVDRRRAETSNPKFSIADLRREVMAAK